MFDAEHPTLSHTRLHLHSLIVEPSGFRIHRTDKGRKKLV